MEMIKEFMKVHVKKLIIGGVLLVGTLGIWGVYKILKK